MEKRVSPRFGPIVLKAQLTIGGEDYEGYIVDLSRDGGFVAMDEPPEEEMEVVIRTLLPFKLGAFAGEARVVWRSDPQVEERSDGTVTGVGVRFTALDERSSRALASYLSRFEALASQIDELPALHDA